MRKSETQPAGEPIPLSYSLPPKQTRVSDWIAWSLIVGVIALIGCLIFTPTIGSRTVEARIAAAKQDISAMTTALDTSQVDVGRYPTTTEGLAALSTRPDGLTKWSGPYVGKAIINDPWMHKYTYAFPATHKDEPFDLSSAGANGKPGDADDITNWQNQ